MHWILVAMLNLIFWQAPAAGPAKKPQAWDVKTIQWEVNSDGTKDALLEGRRDVPGEAFTYAFFLPAGYHEHHWHSSDARVVVVQGALKVSFGETLDLEHMKSYPAGTYLLVPANVKHTMAADEDTVIIGTAVGPWATHRHGEHEHH
ncbi:MAG TPA: cupin domain-containing protein [Candidatus Acidoferrum sp.]|nr:cupin domain-containing protein [Candidatus Acidoferrum sp.]